MGRPPDRFSVPDVVGKSLDLAKRLIRQSGLQVGDVVFEVRENLVPETVISQSGSSETVSWTWDGIGSGGEPEPDGGYAVVLTAAR